MDKRYSKINSNYGRWLVIRPHKITGQRNRRSILCKCSCGIEKYVKLGDLRSGKSTKCRKCATLGKCTVTREWIQLKRVHINMLSRCENKKDSGYKNYGARGIRVCSAWKKFNTFYKWAINKGYKIGLTIERINNNGNYSYKNCKWIPKGQQNLNTRQNVFLIYKGKRKTQKEWSEMLGISYTKIGHRKRSGWTDEMIFADLLGG